MTNTVHRKSHSASLLLSLLGAALLLFFLSVSGINAAAESESSAVTDLTPQNFDKQVLQSDAVWVVAFIAPWCGHCQRLHPEFEKAATSLGGVVRFGRVNCEDHRELATKYQIQGFPTIKIFPPFRDRKRTPTLYEGARTAQSIADAVLKELPSYTVATISDSNVDQFFSAEPQKAKVLLFSNKKQIPPLLKSLALEFWGTLSFAFVKESEQNLCERWQVNSFPRILVMPPRTATSAFAEAGKNLIPYEGSMKKSEIAEFLSKYASMAPKETPSSPSSSFSSSSSSSSSASTKKPSASADVSSLPTLKLDKLENTCKGKLCVIFVLANAASDSSVMRTALDLATLNVHDKSLKFVTVDAATDPALAAHFSIDAKSPPLMAVLRAGKMTKFALCDQCDLKSVTSTQAFLDKVVGGNVQLSHKLSLDTSAGKDKATHDEL